MQKTEASTPFILTFTTALVILVACAISDENGKKGPYVSPLKDAMQKGFKGDESIRSKIIDGKASDADWDRFIDYVKTMQEFKPRKGDLDSWRNKTAALMEAAQAARSDAAKLTTFEEASACKDCHTPHKIYPPKKKKAGASN